ncbi:MAG: hypothetical protein N838_25345 [Thiohalocapsa sp. PB-PSB1]|nr:MAG: hypothetical protein N838_25345 [Thiohalocapsa sp. PB-PSB1]
MHGLLRLFVSQLVVFLCKSLFLQRILDAENREDESIFQTIELLNQYSI